MLRECEWSQLNDCIVCCFQCAGAGGKHDINRDKCQDYCESQTRFYVPIGVPRQPRLRDIAPFIEWPKGFDPTVIPEWLDPELW